jgi:hypothetical protein
LKYDEVKFIYLFIFFVITITLNHKPQTTHHCKLKIHTLFFYSFFFATKKNLTTAHLAPKHTLGKITLAKEHRNLQTPKPRLPETGKGGLL